MIFLRWIPFGRVFELSAEQVAARHHELQIVDVRTKSEFQSGHIFGAQNLPITQFSEVAVRELNLQSDKPVVAVCLSAHRSIPAVRQLRKLGFEAYQLAGGMQSWRQQNRPLEQP